MTEIMDEDDALALSGDENEDELRSARSLELGFTPQKEAELNWLLPCSADVDVESCQLLQDIKSHLGRAVMLREIKPACSMWTSRLIKYIRLYGLKFSKEDHIALVKLVYEMILILDLEPTKLHKLCTLFIMLTKRRYLISPDEMTLAWRPLYDLFLKLFYKSAVQVGMVHYMTTLENTCEAAIRCAQPYFEVSATREILDEVMPRVVLWDKYGGCLELLVLFLPVGLREQYAEQGYKLWLDDVLTLWDTCSNAPNIGDLLLLLSGLAKRSPGLVDWSPHVPLMFARFIHYFNLPVGYKSNPPLQLHTLEINHMATWIVWGIGHDGVMLGHLKSLLAGVESYLHTANSGRWSFKLRDFLKKLARAFLFRVYRERNPKFQKTWENQSPESFRLREEEIDEFVQILLEPALLAVHSRFSGTDSGLALHCLATLRPAVVIPPLLQKLYTSLESLTEPHRVTAAMQAILAVARPLMRGAAAGYPEGPTHVIPILIASLPGLDPNDIRKTTVTLTLTAIFGSMMTFIDCSAAGRHHADLTEEERAICEATAQFEDFVLMFLDRIFTIIESTALETVRLETRDSDSSRTKHDQLLEASIVSASNMVLTQSSPKIVAEALRKFKAFATGATFETQVAGRHVGMLLRTFVRADAKATLAAFVPHVCGSLAELLASEEAIKDEHPPRELLYHLLLLSNAVSDVAVADYFPALLPVLDRAIRCHSRKACTLACETLARIICPFGVTYINDVKGCPRDYGAAPETWLPIREWGAGYPLKSTRFDWHTPSEADAGVVQMLLQRYAVPEMERLRAWLNGREEISRERRLRALSVIHASLACLVILPPLDEPSVELVKSSLPSTRFSLRDPWCRRLELCGADVRRAVGELCLAVQSRLIADKSDDTRSLDCVVTIWECLCVEGRSWRSAAGINSGLEDTGVADGRARMFASAERYLDARGGPAPGGARLRLALCDGATLLQQVRIDMRNDSGMGETAIKIMNALLDLSVYGYAEVRMRAQFRLQWMLTHYAHSFRVLLPRVVHMLAGPAPALNEEEAHCQLKGILFLICGVRSTPLVAKQDWEVISQLWPALLRAPLSEKPSIIRLEQAFMDVVNRHFPTVNTKLEFTDGCVAAARVIVPPEQLNDEEFLALLKDAKARERASSEVTERQYLGLIDDLVAIAELPNTTWRRAMYAVNLLIATSSVQTRYPPSAVRLVARSLVHDNILVRKSAVRLMLFALKQNKLAHVKLKVDPFEVAGVARPEKIVPGYRPDNAWVTFSQERVPTTDEEWDRPWLHGNVGFVSWPKQIEMYAPSSQQPDPERPPAQMSETQRAIYEFFDDDANLEKLVGFLSAEDKKGKDKFNGLRFAMFRSLFRSYGTPLCRKLLAHALKHAGRSHEASQRFAAEVAAAAVRGTKHWTRERAMAIYDDILEVFRVGLNSMTPESVDDWGTGLATAAENVEPHRAAPLLRGLLEMCCPQPSSGPDAEHERDTSFEASGRLLALQGALAALSWRGAALWKEFVTRLWDAKYIQHPYQNVRERIGSILSSAFDVDVLFPGGQRGPAPSLERLLADALPQLAPLYDQHGEIIVQTRAAWAPAARCDAGALPPPHSLPASGLAAEVRVDAARLSDPLSGAKMGQNDGERAPVASGRSRVGRQLAARLDGEQLCGADDDGAAASHQQHARAINLLVTLMRGTVGTIVFGIRGASAGHYELLHAACALSARAAPAAHDELARASDAYLSSIAVVHHTPELFRTALTQVERVCGSRSWWARLSAVEFAQALLFYGLPLLKQSPELAARAEALALKHMRDSRLEVRTAAAKLLTGLMHCSALPDEAATLASLTRSSRSRELVERHCGVLGLCAYLSSRPYTIPAKLGAVLAELLKHTNAPDPMPATIRSALADFKRTHQDDWQRHRDTMSECELDLLTDLTAPPAYCA